VIFYRNREHDPAVNLALEELLCREHPEELLMLWRNAPSVIIGRNQNTLAEINRDYTNAHHIHVVRRMTGGGAVYHDLGNLNYSLIIHERTPSPDSFARFARPVVSALQKLGIPAEFTGRNDIAVNGKKISGSAQTCFGSRTLFHGTMLFDTDFEAMCQALTPGDLKIESKGIKSVRSRVMDLRELLPALSMEQFIETLSSQLSAELQCGKMEELPQEWLAKAQNLADEKYRTEAWNFNSPFSYNYSKTLRFTGGTITAELKIEHNTIAALRVSGDFFSRRDPAELAAKLTGIPFQREAVLSALKGFDIALCIQNAGLEDLLALFSL